MVEILEVPELREPQREMKLENDESYQSAESGINTGDDSSGLVVCKMENNDSSGYESKSGDSLIKNDKVIAEIFDLDCFNPPILNSSNLVANNKICEISTIENDGSAPKPSGKGTYFIEGKCCRN